LLEQPYRFDDAIETDRGSNGTVPEIASKVFFRGGIDPKPSANEVADRFRFKLANGM
jgi:hypothetical protein